MSRAALILATAADRAKAIAWINKAPWNTRVEFKAPKRSIPQNDKMWAALTDVAEQLSWHGQKLSTEDWKVLFLGALKQELRLVPNLNNNGFVTLGRSSSDLSKAEMIDLIEIIHAFGAERGVHFHEPVSAPSHEAARATGLPHGTILSRLDAGKSDEEAIRGS